MKITFPPKKQKKIAIQEKKKKGKNSLSQSANNYKILVNVGPKPRFGSTCMEMESGPNPPQSRGGHRQEHSARDLHRIRFNDAGAAAPHHLTSPATRFPSQKLQNQMLPIRFMMVTPLFGPRLGARFGTLFTATSYCQSPTILCQV